MKLRWILPLLFFLPSLAFAQSTYNASTCSETDVQSAYSTEQASKVDGDIINIPSCSGGTAWTSSWSISPTNSLTLQGQTTVTGNCTGSSPTCTVTDTTVIIDNVSRSGGDVPLIQVTTPSGKAFRMTGITLKTNGSSQQSFNGAIVIAGSSTSVRLDDMHWNMPLHGKQARVIGCVYGVMDHSEVELTAASTNNFMFLDQGSCGGDGLGVGNGQWNEATNLGSSGSFYFENNVFNGGTNSGGSGATVVPFVDDCSGGGRFVFRFNILNGVEAQGHATGHSDNPPDRSCRSYEIYQNTYGSTGTTSATNPGEAAFFNTGGTGVIWGNTFPGSYKNMIEEVEDRMNASTYTQSATPSGWGYCASSAVGGVGGPSNWDQNTSGQSGWACLDQVGRGQGDLLQGSFPNVCDATSTDCTNGIYTGRWPNQALEPVYEWLDQWHTPSGWAGVLWSGDGVVTLANRDYYTYTLAWNGSSFAGTSFTGASGTGSGTLSARPSTCTTGVAYWATDQGSWNGSGSGGNGVLYKCTATNTWTSYYTPYTYPHPLISGGTPTTATPVLSPSSESFAGTISVSITDSTGGSTIYYTTDGSTPTTFSTVYSSAISVSSTTTVQAIAAASGDVNSSVATGTYTLMAIVATPTFSPGSESFTGSVSVSISDTTPSSTIYYTTDGSTPTTSSTVYTTAISVTATKTIKAIAAASGDTNSSVASSIYTLLPTSIPVMQGGGAARGTFR